MVDFPTKPEEYRAYLQSRQNAIELLLSSVSSSADRLDIMNQLLLLLNNQISAMLYFLSQGGSGGGGGGTTPPNGTGTPGWPNAPMIASGTHLVTTAGSARQFPQRYIPDGMCVSIKAPTTNAGNVYVGNTAADAIDHSTGYMLDAGDVIQYYIKDLSQLWLDADSDGEGVVWTCERSV